jgi:hypothetical protein
MYKIIGTFSDEFNSMIFNARYCLTRKSAIKLANLLLKSNRNIIVAKWSHCGDIFFWSDAWEDTKIIIDEENLTARKANKDDF